MKVKGVFQSCFGCAFPPKVNETPDASHATPPSRHSFLFRPFKSSGVKTRGIETPLQMNANGERALMPEDSSVPQPNGRTPAPVEVDVQNKEQPLTVRDGVNTTIPIQPHDVEVLNESTATEVTVLMKASTEDGHSRSHSSVSEIHLPESPNENTQPQMNDAENLTTEPRTNICQVEIRTQEGPSTETNERIKGDLESYCLKGRPVLERLQNSHVKSRSSEEVSPFVHQDAPVVLFNKKTSISCHPILLQTASYISSFATESSGDESLNASDVE